MQFMPDFIFYSLPWCSVCRMQFQSIGKELAGGRPDSLVKPPVNKNKIKWNHKPLSSFELYICRLCAGAVLFIPPLISLPSSPPLFPVQFPGFNSLCVLEEAGEHVLSYLSWPYLEWQVKSLRFIDDPLQRREKLQETRANNKAVTLHLFGPC